MSDEGLVATLNGRRVVLHRFERLFPARFEDGALGVVLHEPALRHQIGGAEVEHAARRLTISSRTPGFLVVGLDAARRLEVDDESDVGDVDTHAERVGRDEQPGPSNVERSLGALAGELGAAGMVVADREAFRAQGLRHGLHGFAGAAVDDAASLAAARA